MSNPENQKLRTEYEVGDKLLLRKLVVRTAWDGEKWLRGEEAFCLNEKKII